MFRRTLATIVVAAAVILGVAFAAPSFAASPAPGPTITHPVPPGYPATVPTFTRAWATPARANGAAKIFVAVFSGAGIPTGTVTITVAGTSATVPLHGGAASYGVTGLTPGRHTVSVTYNPTPGSQWKPSSATTTVRVFGVRTRTTVSAPTIRVGNPARITARVTAFGAQPTGTVTFAVAGRAFSAPLTHGTATVSVPGLRAGTYLVTAAFTPSDPSFVASSGATSLRVRGWRFGDVGFFWGLWPPSFGWHPSPFPWGFVWFT